MRDDDLKFAQRSRSSCCSLLLLWESVEWFLEGDKSAQWSLLSNESDLRPTRERNAVRNEGR